MRRWSLGAILVALVTIGTLWSRHNLRVKDDVSTALLGAVNGGTPAGSPTPRPLNIAQDKSEVSDRDDPAKVRRMIEAGNVPINFWGKVTDQDGVPLQGVTVAYTCFIHHGNDFGVAWIELEERKGQAVSDASGSFAMTGLTGNALALDSLNKTGYVYRMRHSLTYDFGGNMPERRFEPRRDKPVSFVMANERILEPLIHMRGGLGVSGDGTVARWSLWSGEPDDDGELAVSLRREPAVLTWPKASSTWSADLQIVGGEIMVALWGEEVYRAPEAGYSAAVPYPKEPLKEGVSVRPFYLRTRNGNYGRIQVELYPDDPGPSARCFITSDMNPRPGSRILEPTEEE